MNAFCKTKIYSRGEEITAEGEGRVKNKLPLEFKSGTVSCAADSLIEWLQFWYIVTESQNI